MKQNQNIQAPQVNYYGRWVDKNTFRAFVYGIDKSILANSWDHYEQLLATGEWFGTKEEVKKPKKPKASKFSVDASEDQEIPIEQVADGIND